MASRWASIRACGLGRSCAATTDEIPRASTAASARGANEAKRVPIILILPSAQSRSLAEEYARPGAAGFALPKLMHLHLPPNRARIDHRDAR